ncbi:MAG: flagellar basal body L-ring protein FlgH [Deltaproteobacteria bacterium]|nr:flagellar basal body L-ring protein FlgH [Deltaproteobacteria bacterium]
MKRVGRAMYPFAVLAALFNLSACSLVQSLRDDLDDGDANKRRMANNFNNFDYTAPENRNLPPAPATVLDERTSPIAGTPVDLSGTRAKSGRVTKNDFAQEAAKNDYSLWTEDGQNNYLFARNKLKAPGDLVTIRIEDDLRKDMVMEVKKLLPPEFRDRDINVPGITKDLGKEDRTVASVATAAGASEYARTDVMTGEVLERYPNGNVRLRGVKRIPFKRKVRNMDVIAIVRGSDIDEHDTIQSSKFLEHRVELYK